MRKRFLIIIGSIFLVALLIFALTQRQANQESQPVQEAGWFSEYQVISHALGGIDGYDYTNSYEALDNAYSLGQRVVEADFRFTSDDILVLRHNWNDDLGQPNVSNKNVPTYEEFKNTLIFEKYTPMSVEELAVYMHNHDDMYLVTDVKHKLNSESLITAIDGLVRIFKEQDESILERVIIQIYCENDYEKINNIYPFSNWIYTLYKQEDEYRDNYGEVAEFCKENNIPVVTMPAKWVKGAKDISVLTKNNIKVYVHTLNDLDKVKKLFEYGASGIYSDYILESDL